MKSRKATTLYNLFFQGCTVALAFISGIVLVPLYLRYIPSDLYGAWSASGNVLTWITLCDPGISLVLQQRVATAYGRQDHAEVSGWIASGLLITAAISVLIIVTGMCFSFFFTAWMDLPAAVNQLVLARAFRWNVIGMGLMVFSFSIALINQGLQGSLWVGIITVSANLLRIMLVILLLINGFGLLAIALPSVVIGLVLIAGNLTYLYLIFRTKGVPFPRQATHLRQLLGVLSFTSIGRLAGTLANNVDLFFVARLLGPETVNVLRFTRCAPEMSRLFVERPFVAIHPALAHLLGSGDVDRARCILLRLLRLTFWFLALLVGGFAVFNECFIHLWVGEKFYAGGIVNGIVVAGFFMASCASVLAGLCFTAGNISKNSMIGVAQVLVYLPLLWAGGHWFGLRGVAIASLLSVVLTQGWYMPGAFIKIYRLTVGDRRKLGRCGLQAVLATALVTVLFHSSHPSTWLALSVSVAAFCVCFVLLALLLSKDVREEVRAQAQWARRFLPASSGGIKA